MRNCKQILEGIRNWVHSVNTNRHRKIENQDWDVRYVVRDLENALFIINKLVDRDPELLRDIELSKPYSAGSEAWSRGERFWLLDNLLQSNALVNYREVEDRESAQVFEKAITAEDFSHISTREQFGGSAHAYRDDAKSPSGVLNSASISMSNRYYKEILEQHNKTAHSGPQRGEKAGRR